MRDFTDEELILRIWDQEKIRDLMARYVHFEAANRREDILSQLWVSHKDNMASASFGRNWGFITGLDNIRSYYLKRNRFGTPGTALMHPLSTKLIHIAENGATAQGIWMSLAYEISGDDSGELGAKWVNERFACDFVNENGQWKIWHLFIGTNYVLNTGENYVQQPLNTKEITQAEHCPDWYVVGHGREVDKGLIALFDQIPEYREREAFLEVAQPLDVYSAVYNDPIAFPSLPSEYEAYDSRRGYGPDGFAEVKNHKQGKVFYS